MSAWLDLLSGFGLLAGGMLCLTGAVGILRFPDFFSRVHAAGITETLAVPLLLGSLALRSGWSLDTAKLVLIMLFVLATNPTAAHAMSRAALQGGKRPLVGSSRDREEPPSPS